jgi:hypothetical protein
MRTLKDFADVTFQRGEPQRWRILSKDRAGFISCGLVLAIAALFAWHGGFYLSSRIFWLLALGLCAFLVGLGGFIRAALRRQFAPLSLAPALIGLLPIYLAFVIFTLAMQH